MATKKDRRRVLAKPANLHVTIEQDDLDTLQFLADCYGLGNLSALVRTILKKGIAWRIRQLKRQGKNVDNRRRHWQAANYE